MKLKRLLIVPALVAMLLLSSTFVTAYAEELVPEPEDTATENPVPGVTVPEYAVTIKFTSDSSTSKGITYDTYVDPATFSVGFKIINDLPVGHIIYDDPNTSYIDGIRINGETVDKLTVIVEQGTTYDVIVKTVYEDNLLGDFAKIIDGNFDFKTLLANPVALFMCSYYIIAIVALVVSTFTTLVSKNKKVKTADEIAAKVDESADEAVAKVKTEVTNTVIAEITPILQRIFDGMQNIVTAVTLSTSKNKEAPLAMLDTLQKTVEVNNLTELFDGIRKDVTEGIAKEEDVKATNLETLREIAQSAATIVEVVSESTNKSVF